MRHGMTGWLITLMVASWALAQPRVVQYPLGVPGRETIDAGSVTVADDGISVAFWEGVIHGRTQHHATAAPGQTVRIVHNTQPGRDWHLVSRPILSRDGRRIFYVASDGRNIYPVLDGRAYDLQLEGVCDEPVFSDDGSTLAFVGKLQNGRHQLFVNLRPVGQPHEKISRLVLSPNGERSMAMVQRGERCRIMLDGQLRREWDGIGVKTARFSPDGRRFTYAAHVGDQWFYIIDDDTIGPFSGLYAPGVVFSHDSRRVAYRAAEWPYPSNIQSWDADGNLLMGGQRIFIDGQIGPATANIPVRFLLASDQPLWVEAGPSRQRVVIGDRPSEWFDEISHLSTSPNGIGIAYVGARAGKRQVILNGQVISTHDEIAHLSLSADGHAIAVAVIENGKAVVYHNGRAGARHDETLMLAISPDGRHVAYWGKSQGRARLVVNERAGDGYEAPLPGSKIVWRSPDEFSALARVGGTIHRIDGRLDGQPPTAQVEPEKRRESSRVRVRR